MRTLLALSLLAFTAPAPAQSFVVSPAQYSGYEAAAASDLPFSTQSRYQQIHGDLRGTPRTFNGIAWRRDAQVATNQGFVGRTLDMEIACGPASYAALSATYASNYTGAATTVFTRKTVVSPDFTQQPDSPAPWLFALVFDAPFAHAGTGDLLWDARVHSSTAGPNTTLFLDAASGRDQAVVGASIAAGTGCTTTNGVMQLRSSFVTNGGTSTLGLNWSLARGPSSTAAVLLVGRTDPNLFLPALCPPGNSLHTDLAFFTVVGVTDALGAWTVPAINLPWNAQYAGARLTSQAVAIDLPQGGYGVAASNGLSSTAAPVPVAIQLARLYATGAGSANATTGTLQGGYGLVTRLRY